MRQRRQRILIFADAVYRTCLCVKSSALQILRACADDRIQPRVPRIIHIVIFPCGRGFQLAQDLRRQWNGNADTGRTWTGCNISQIGKANQSCSSSSSRAMANFSFLCKWIAEYYQFHHKAARKKSRMSMHVSWCANIPHLRHFCADFRYLRKCLQNETAVL